MLRFNSISTGLIVAVVIISGCLVGNVNPQSRLGRIFRQFVIDVSGKSIDDPRWLQIANSNNKIQDTIPESVKFPCTDKSLFKSKTKPTSVHTLRPGDIDLIGALGDSLTVANGAGASNVLQIITENRGVSWSIGGKGNWRKFLTLPNIIKEFNPKLVGFAKGDSLSYSRSSQFNVAETGAFSMDLPFMVRELVKRIKQDPRVDLQNDWKLITIMMGANDFCFNICYYSDPLSALDEHKKELNYTLTYLMKHLPRTMINLVPAPDVEIIKAYTNISPICTLTHRIFCPCFHNDVIKSSWPQFREVIKRWRQFHLEIPDAPEFSREDFAVVSQPFSMDIKFMDRLGNTDYAYLSTDCFHFSQKGHARAANGLWKNMMEPVGNKSTNWPKLFDKISCPTPSNPYIFTRKNSGNAENFYGNSENNVYKRNAVRNL
ncbi:phospholipase B1, membrane-associated-like [Arctopsyche grandis]|uniref:phospholipase B1, membrane-associated-like n=1 Tax=Arctopsyche grandis TaxID=121162 RepID=UPI00406D699E